MTREIFSRNECKIKIYVVDEKCYVYIEYYSATRLVVQTGRSKSTRIIV